MTRGGRACKSASQSAIQTCVACIGVYIHILQFLLSHLIFIYTYFHFIYSLEYNLHTKVKFKSCLLFVRAINENMHAWQSERGSARPCGTVAR